MTDELTDGWPSLEDRQLMVRAVARYSDQCEAPELTPECPFYATAADGTPACAEECQDLIARFPEDLAPDPPFGLGAGLSATRRRPRRGPSKDEPAFDAGQALLQDQGKPLSEWRAGSLLRVARDKAYSPNDHALEIDSQALFEEIARRIPDVDRYIFPGLARDRANALVVAIIVSEEEHGAEIRQLITAHSEAWVDAMVTTAGLDEVPPKRQQLLTPGTVAALRNYFATMEAQELLADAPPDTDRLLACVGVSVDNEDVSDSQWLLERFTHTYLGEWSTSSLVREWRFVNASRLGCAPPGVMRERRLDPAQIAAALADEACSKHERESEKEHSWTANHFRRVALERLRAGKPRAAADVFRVKLDLEPGVSDVLNDLGFCLLACDPDDAIVVLKEALTRGTSNPSLTLLNLGLGRHWIGDGAGAISAVRQVLGEGLDNESDRSAWIWVPRAGETAELKLENDILEYAERLAEHFATCADACFVARDDATA